jgi:hypothetical protein
MKYVITESQYKLLTEDLGVSRASIPFTNLIYDFVRGKVKSLFNSDKKIEETLPTDFRWEHGFTYCFSLAGIASATKYLDILERDRLLDNHDQLVDTAMSVFKECGFTVTSRFGLHFYISNDQENYFYIILLIHLFLKVHHLVKFLMIRIL